MSDIKLIGDYNGIKIVWDSYQGLLSANIDGQTINARDWPALERKIKAAFKKEFKPIEVFISSGYRANVKNVTGRVTSIDGEHAWVSLNQKWPKRSKERIKNIYLNSPENMHRLTEIKKLEDKIKDIEKELKAYWEDMENIESIIKKD